MVTMRHDVRYLPLTPEIVSAHLAGQNFIGLYPLLPANDCHFLTADFDGVQAGEEPSSAEQVRLLLQPSLDDRALTREVDKGTQLGLRLERAIAIAAPGRTQLVTNGPPKTITTT